MRKNDFFRYLFHFCCYFLKKTEKSLVDFVNNRNILVAILNDKYICQLSF